MLYLRRDRRRPDRLASTKVSTTVGYQRFLLWTYRQRGYTAKLVALLLDQNRWPTKTLLGDNVRENSFFGCFRAVYTGRPHF